MNVTYIAASNTATGGTALGLSGQNVEVVKLIVGNPVSSANIYIYGETNPGATSNTTGLAAKLTLPASVSTSQLPFTLDLTDADGHGIALFSGGNIMIDQSLQLTVVWGIPQLSGNTL